MSDRDLLYAFALALLYLWAATGISLTLLSRWGSVREVVWAMGARGRLLRGIRGREVALPSEGSEKEGVP